MIQNTKSRPGLGIKIIAVINGIAALLHIIFWIFAFIHLPSISYIESASEKINLATVYGFGLADIIWSVHFLFFGSLMLLKDKLIGWLCANFANVLYWY